MGAAVTGMQSPCPRCGGPFWGLRSHLPFCQRRIGVHSRKCRTPMGTPDQVECRETLGSRNGPLGESPTQSDSARINKEGDTASLPRTAPMGARLSDLSARYHTVE